MDHLHYYTASQKTRQPTFNHNYMKVLADFQNSFTHCASVHQAAKLVAALLRVAGVTAGLAESNGSLPPGS